MMALPQLNTVNYELTIPSSDQVISYRPFMVKEEKVLLTVLESQDSKQITSAIKDIVEVCTFNSVKLDSLAMYDLEYIFLKLRSKSVGESAKLGFKCKECEELNEVDINLENITLTGNPKAEASISLTDIVGVSMKYPTVKNVERLLQENKDASSTDLIIAMIAASIVSIYDAESVYPAEESTPKELIDFIESLNKGQFAKLQEFFNEFPRLREEVKFTCTKCGTENEVVLEGLNDFFA